jgi:hypothetical protein
MSKEEKQRDDVLRRMLKTPPVVRKPLGKRRKSESERMPVKIRKRPTNSKK